MSKKSKKQLNVFICEYCNKEHDGTYGSGRFCSPRCSRKYSNTFVSEEGRQNQIEVLNKTRNTGKKKSKPNNEIIIPKKYKKQLKTNNSARIGKVGEYKVAIKLLERNIPVYLPMTETEEADLIAEFGGKLQKIQVKSSNQLTGKYNDVIHFGLTNSDHKVSHGKIVTSNKLYSTEQVDYYALYNLPDDEIYLLKNNCDRQSIKFRDSYPETGQKIGIHITHDYDIDRVLDLIEAGIDPDDIIESD